MAHPIELLFSGIGKVASTGVSALQAGAVGKMAIGAGVGGLYGASQGYDINSRIEGFAKGAIFGSAAGAAIGLGPSFASSLSRKGYKGAKKLWSANMAAGERAMQKRARLMEFGDSMTSGPLPRDMQPSRLQAAGRSPVGRAVDTTLRAGMFALDRPIGTLAVAGGIGAGLYAMGGTGSTARSPSLAGARTNISYNQQAMMAAEIGQIGTGMIGSADMMKDQFDYANWMATTGKSALASSRMGRLANSTVGLPQGLHSGRHG